MHGNVINSIPANRRNVNTVFQQYALFPHLTVFENIAYGLRAKCIAASEIKTRVESALAQVRNERDDFTPAVSIKWGDSNNESRSLAHW